MPDKVCILVSGYSESGKDTIAKLAVKEFGFVRVGFADLLKDKVARDFDLVRELLDDKVYKSTPLLDLPVVCTDKDTFAQYIQTVELFPHFRTEDGVAPNYKEPEKLSRFAGVMLWDGKQLYQTPRSLMILEGSAKRTANPHYWIDTPINKLIGKNIIVSDCRYPNEDHRTRALLEKHGYVVHTIRIDVDKASSAVDASERGMDDFPNFYCRIFNEKLESEEEGIRRFHDKCRPVIIKIMSGLDKPKV